MRWPSTQATMRRLVRSTASQSQTCAAAGPQTSPFHRVRAPPIPGVGPFSAAGGARAGVPPALFLSVWPPSCVLYRSRAQCCVGNCARPTAFPPARSERPAPPPPAQSGLSGHTTCIGTWRGLDYCHCAKCVHRRKRRRGGAL